MKFPRFVAAYMMPMVFGDAHTDPKKCPKCGSEMLEEYHLRDWHRQETAEPFWMCQNPACGYWEEKVQGGAK